jgi:hypothetical protein
MKTPASQQRYFVVHLREEDRPAPDERFEVQVLDSNGRAACCGYVGYEQSELEVAGGRIPRPVIEAARRQLIGQGDYLDETGNSVPPF